MFAVSQLHLCISKPARPSAPRLSASPPRPFAGALLSLGSECAARLLAREERLLGQPNLRYALVGPLGGLLELKVPVYPCESYDAVQHLIGAADHEVVTSMALTELPAHDERADAR